MEVHEKPENPKSKHPKWAVWRWPFQKDDTTRIGRLATFLTLASLVFYGSAYLACIRYADGWSKGGFGNELVVLEWYQPPLPQHPFIRSHWKRMGSMWNKWLRPLFWPANQFDRILRPGRWSNEYAAQQNDPGRSTFRASSR